MGTDGRQSRTGDGSTRVTTIERSARSRLGRLVSAGKARLARLVSGGRRQAGRLLPPRAELESVEDARRAARRAKWISLAIAALALGAAALHWYTMYALGLLFALIAFGRVEWYGGWKAGYEARRAEHRRELGL